MSPENGAQPDLGGSAQAADGLGTASPYVHHAKAVFGKEFMLFRMLCIVRPDGSIIGEPEDVIDEIMDDGDDVAGMDDGDDVEGDAAGVEEEEEEVENTPAQKKRKTLPPESFSTHNLPADHTLIWKRSGKDGKDGTQRGRVADSRVHRYQVCHQNP